LKDNANVESKHFLFQPVLVQVKFAKYILEVNKTASNLAVLGELGIFFNLPAMIYNVYFLYYCIFCGTNVPMTICILISYMYVLSASKKCCASWPIKFIKGARPGLKRPAHVTVQQTICYKNIIPFF
jgi:hypothetical protein